MYNVSIKKSALKELRSIPEETRKNIKELLLKLQEDPLPEGCRKLRVYENCYRIRKGSYRILYEIKTDNTVMVFKIGHRKDVY